MLAPCKPPAPRLSDADGNESRGLQQQSHGDEAEIRRRTTFPFSQEKIICFISAILEKSLKQNVKRIVSD